MARIAKIKRAMENNPKGIRFKNLCQFCEHYFGSARPSASSHRIYRTPWQGDTRVNIQNDNGMAKAYQVKQVLKAIKKLENEDITTD